MTIGGISTSPQAAEQRRVEAFEKRQSAAVNEFLRPVPHHPNNGDEERYPEKFANYSKGLVHNALGEVDLASYGTLINALTTGNPSDFENITLGGTATLVDPQSGLAYDLEGGDSHALYLEPAPAFASAEKAGEAVELYWQALLRDVPFSQYPTDPEVTNAINDLNALSDFRGPKDPSTHQITPNTLFRGSFYGDLVGPYISQFLYKELEFGAAQLVQQFQTLLPLNAGGADWMTDFPSWLAVQNGQGPFPANRFDPQRRYIRCGRDISQYVHVDVLFEAYFNACLYLVDIGAPFNPGNPYVKSKTQQGFGTFGTPHLKALVAEVATRALKCVWYQKWFVHRELRPEEFGGRVHNTLTGTKAYPLHADILNSAAVQAVFDRNQTYLLPHAFPEGCPQHPSYGQGHGTVAGACATIVKAFFDDTWVIPDPVVPTDDGLNLVPYTGADAGQLTVAGEMNKLAANIALGRNHAAVHWRSDYRNSVLLGEEVAIRLLRDQKPMYNEDFKGLTFTKFDGTAVTV